MMMTTTTRSMEYSAPLRRGPAGFTLLELLVSSAMASVIVAAAVSVFVTLAAQQRTAERLVEAQSSTFVAVAAMQMDVGNAGYRLPLPAFAVRHLEVDSATSLPSVGSTTITPSGNCGTLAGGLVEGTDVLELAEGYALMGPGRAEAAAVTGGASVSFTLGGIGEPFSHTEATGGAAAPAVNSILVFANATGASCLVRVATLDTPGLTSGTGTLVDRDYQALSSSAFYPGCPAAGMQVYRLGARYRYMVCKPTATAAPREYTLYRQVAGLTGFWQAPDRLQEGVEDLQVSLAYANLDGGIEAAGTASTCVTGPSGTSFCYCDDKVSGACTLGTSDVEPGLTAITGTSLVSLVRGIRIQLTGMGQRTAVAPGATNEVYRRPDSFDHAGMVASAADNYSRVQQQFSFVFHNLQVVP